MLHWLNDEKKNPIYFRCAQWTSNLFKVLGWSIVSHIIVFRKFYESSRFLEIILGLSGQSLCIFKHTFSSFKFKFKVIHYFVIDQATKPHRYNLVNLYCTIKVKKNHQKKCIFSFFCITDNTHISPNPLSKHMPISDTIRTFLTMSSFVLFLWRLLFTLNCFLSRL